MSISAAGGSLEQIAACVIQVTVETQPMPGPRSHGHQLYRHGRAERAREMYR